MKTVSFKVPTYADVKYVVRVNRTSMSNQLTKLAKRIEPKPKPAKAKAANAKARGRRIAGNPPKAKP